MYKFFFSVLISLLIGLSLMKTHLQKTELFKKSSCDRFHLGVYANKWWFYKDKCKGFKLGEYNKDCSRKCLLEFKNNKQIIGVCGKTILGGITCECCWRKH